MRRLVRFLHRDIGYVFSGLLMIYALSGVALNHRRSWNPREYVVESQAVSTGLIAATGDVSEETVQAMMDGVAPGSEIRDFRVTNERELRVFIEGARLAIDLNTGDGELE